MRRASGCGVLLPSSEAPRRADPGWLDYRVSATGKESIADGSSPMKLKTLFYLLPRAGKFLQAVRGMRNQDILTTREHLRLCADWLLYSQAVHQCGGYAASYSLITGLRHPYIETTGYIIPTMFDLGAALGDARCRESALRAGEWLLTVQQPDGAFTDIDEF